MNEIGNVSDGLQSVEGKSCRKRDLNELYSNEEEVSCVVGGNWLTGMFTRLRTKRSLANKGG